MSLFTDVSADVTVHLRTDRATDALGNEVVGWDGGTTVSGIVVPGDTADMSDALTRPDGTTVDATLYMKEPFDTLRDAVVETQLGTFRVVGDPLPWPPVIDGWRWAVPLERAEG